jgi:PAS domain S-box-containing protein
MTAKDVTLNELTAGDAELERRLRVLEAVLANINQGVSFFNGDLTLDFCNQRYLELLKFPLEFGTPGTPFETFIRYNAERGEYGPGDPDEQVRQRVEMSRQRLAHRFERTRPDDGTTLEIIGTPVADGGFVTTYADITELKQQQQEIAESQRRLGMALEGADLGLWDWDLRGDCLTSNARFLEMIGRPDTLSLDKGLMNFLLHPDDRDTTRHALSNHLKGITPLFECEYRVLHHDDHWVWLLVRGKVVQRDTTGKALRAIGTALDVTERKKNEALLLERERRLATLVRSMQDLIFVLDTTGTVLEYWPAPGFDLGVDVVRITGHQFSEVLPEALASGLQEGMVELFMDGISKKFEFSFGQAFTRTHFQVTISRLADSSKYASGFLVVVRDISEVQELRDALGRVD